MIPHSEQQVVTTHSTTPAGPPGEPGTEAEGELKLGELLQALQRRRRLIAVVTVMFTVVGAANAYWDRTFHPTYQGGFRLLVSNPINDSGGEGGTIANVALQRGGTADTATLIEVLTSPLVLESLERKLKLPGGSISGALTVSPGGTRGGSLGVLSVSLLWPDPVEGERILSKLSQEYLSYSLRQRQEKLSQGLDFLDQQAPDLQRRVNALQIRLAEIRQSNGFVEPEDQATAILSQREDLLSERKRLQMEQARLEGRAAAVRRGELGTAGGAQAPPPRGPVNPPGTKELGGEAAADPGLETASDGMSAAVAEGGGGNGQLDQLLALESALAEAEANFTADSPQVQELRAKRDWLKPLVQQRLSGELQSSLTQNLAQQREIQLQLEKVAQGFADNPQRMRTYENLKQQLQVAQDSLSSYIKARESFRLQMAQRTVPWRILSPPQFGTIPVAPSVSRNLGMSLALGAGAGIALALLRDWLDHVFHSPKEVKDSLKLPLLGAVPFVPGLTDKTISEAIASMEGGLRFATKESLRNLFTNFRMLRTDKDLRLVAVTSATQGEGKTTTTALFAQTLAQLGQRVLLVDADMRRPMLHRTMGTDNGEGLSSLLTDSSVPLAQTIRPLMPGLDLITGGPMPPDATRLLSSKRCGALVEEIRALPGYDLVLFDTPPALLLSDPVLLASHLDGLVFLVGLERVNRDLPAQALQRIAETGVDVLGVLANQSLGRASGVKGYGYGRGYGYGYGYGYGERDGYSAYAEAAQRQAGEGVEASRNGTAEPSADQPKKRSRRRESPLRAGTRRVMAWLDHRD